MDSFLSIVTELLTSLGHVYILKELGSDCLVEFLVTCLVILNQPKNAKYFIKNKILPLSLRLCTSGLIYFENQNFTLFLEKQCLPLHLYQLSIDQSLPRHKLEYHGGFSYFKLLELI